jgi:hypothetical protein
LNIQLLINHLSFLQDNGIYYTIDNTILCPGGSVMRLYPASSTRSSCWRCHGVIINRVTGIRCCNGSRTTERTGSFFFNRSLEANKVLAILYEWISGVKRGQIAKRIGCSGQSVRVVLNSLQQILQEDLLLEEDLRIGNTFTSNLKNM